MTLDKAMREAMTKCALRGGAVVEVTYTLGSIPWKITVEIDEDKINLSNDESSKS